MFSLCIPTIDRFGTFLGKYLEQYLSFDLVDEIIICDENGNDYCKINEKFQSDKLKVYKNESVLGPFLNKLKVCKLAKNDWIVLMDSDNFAESRYFETAKQYIIDNNLTNNSVISPSFAKPGFDYRKHIGKVYTKTNKINDDCLLNTGNYVLNKYLIDNLDISKELENIKMSSASDVIFFNTLLFEQLDLQFHVVKDLEYLHVQHKGSIYLTTCNNFKHFNENIYKRYKLL